MKDLSYATISAVLESWEMARRLPDFENTVGEIALLKLFELEPRTKEVFGIDRKLKVTKEALKPHLPHAVAMIHMFDAAFSMLGPDSETLEEILEQLGKRHIKYGVEVHYYPFMGKAIFHALEIGLGDRWDSELADAWQEVYDELSAEIMKSILNGKADIQARKRYPSSCR